MQNVIIAGISQGCATVIFALLASGMRVGGFFGLCGWLPLADEIMRVMNVPGRAKDVLETPVLLQHSEDDEVVPVENGEGLAVQLKQCGMSVRWQRFEGGGHWLNEPEGMDGVVGFIEEVVKAT
jgi:lysophospholipase-2